MSKLKPTRIYSNPTANDILRRMLDEREVEYVVDEEYGEKYPPEQRVTWSCDLAGEDMTVTARDYCISINDDGSADYCLDLEFHEVFTPAQAIAATLGSCNCSNNCTNSERTEMCHDEGDPSDFCCSECGVRMFTNTSDTYTMIASDGRTIIKHPNYCPNCGRRVEQ